MGRGLRVSELDMQLLVGSKNWQSRYFCGRF